MTKKSMSVRQKVDLWKMASQLIDPMIEQHGIELVTSGPMFGPTYKTTKIEQHINHIISVADWLADRDQGV